MYQLIEKIEAKYKKAQIPQVKSGDTIRIHQQISEGEKTRVQTFEGVVVRVKRKNSLMNTVTVRRLASGVGVEKTYSLHAPNIVKVEVVKRAKVRRNYLSYLRERQGKSARMGDIAFDKESVNTYKEKSDEPEPKEDKQEKSDSKEDEAKEPKEQKDTPKDESKESKESKK